MGQKVNPNIFRLGINKTWKTEFFEKKKNELPLYTFKDLEIKDYLERFLETHNILLHDYKQYFSDSTLNLYISYFVTHDFFKSTSSVLALSLTDKAGNRKKVSMKDARQQTLISTNSYNRSLWKSKNVKDLYELKNYFKSRHSDINFLPSKSLIDKDFKSPKLAGVLENFFKVLSLFTKNRLNISVNFRCVNKDLSFLKITQRKNFILLQKFRNTPFLRDGIELLFHVVCNNTSANLLAKFIASQIRKTKRHKFFLSFLKQSLSTLLRSSVSKVKGVKIIIKGRLNGVPRAKHKIITMGDVPAQSISEHIDYAQTTVHNSNGSYGIKVWIVER